MGRASQIKPVARELGFSAVAVTSAEDLRERGEAALERVQLGYLSVFPWFNEERARQTARPASLLPGARSVVAVTLAYYQGEAPPPPGGPQGRLARYAWGRDYHQVMRQRLRTLLEGIGTNPAEARLLVDTGPLLERAAAERAGLGFVGKNTCLIVPGYGSWAFLGEIVLTQELEPDEPLANSCGECDLCLRACPTGALVAPYTLDARRCLSYLTIENRGPIPGELRPYLGDRLFGCDACQEVCPRNRGSRVGAEEFQVAQGPGPFLDPRAFLRMDASQFRARFRPSALGRARLSGLQRNACVVLGNWGDHSAVPLLVQVLREDEVLVRGHAAWALGRIVGTPAREALEKARLREGEDWVQREIGQALEKM